MRVAIITESYAPDINGVANSVSRIATHLALRGHIPQIIAPRPATPVNPEDPFPVLRVRSLPLPGYPSVRLSLPTARLTAALRAHRPDVVHLASPFVLGAWAARAAEALDIPIVAVYQTDVPGYARAYRVALAEKLAWRWLRDLHGRADLTLAPSSTSAGQLASNGIPRVTRWGRGVDTALFHPARRDPDLHRSLAPDGELVVGYVGRLAREKRVELLAATARLPGVRVVIVGDGPTRESVRRELPAATFLGTRCGTELARLYASFDVFVHTGPYETFCQTIQEAQASGLPVIAPAAGGPLDLIDPGRTGILVPPNDSAAIAAAVAGLAGDAGSRARYALAARAAVADRTWAALGDELIAHYRTAIGAQPQPRLPAGAAA